MTIDSTSPQNCEFTYAAMRAGFVSTLDGLLRLSLDPDSNYSCPIGFLSCFPMLSGMAPQIQLECLLKTWQTMGSSQQEPRELLDELVIYAAYEALAVASEEKRAYSLKAISNGPRNSSLRSDTWLHSKARCLQLTGSGSSEPLFLRELAQIQDPNPWFDTEMGQNWCEKREELLELVGRWAASREVILGSAGLLTQDEQDILRAFFEEHPGLVR